MKKPNPEERAKLAESCFKFYCDGFTFSRIAQVVGITYPTIRVYLHEYYNIRPTKRLKEVKPSVCTHCGQTPTKRDKGELNKIRLGIKREAYYDKKGKRHVRIIDNGTVAFLCSRPGCLAPDENRDMTSAREYVMRRTREQSPSAWPTF